MCMHGHGCSLEDFSAFIYCLQGVLLQDNCQKLRTGLGSLRLNSPATRTAGEGAQLAQKPQEQSLFEALLD